MIARLSWPEIHQQVINISDKIKLSAERVFALISAGKSFPTAGFTNKRFLRSPADWVYFLLEKSPSHISVWEKNPICEIIFSPPDTQKIPSFYPTCFWGKVNWACISQIQASSLWNVCARIDSDCYSWPEPLSRELWVFPDYVAILEQTEAAITLLVEKLKST